MSSGCLVTGSQHHVTMDLPVFMDLLSTGRGRKWGFSSGPQNERELQLHLHKIKKKKKEKKRKEKEVLLGRHMEEQIRQMQWVPGHGALLPNQAPS